MFIINFCLNMFRASLCPSSALFASYNAAPHNRYKPHPAEPVLGPENVRINSLSMKREKPTRCNNWMFIINFFLNMFRASLCPSSGDQRPCYCIWCIALVLLDVVGSGCGALRCRMWAVLASYNASSRHFALFHEEDARSNNPQIYVSFLP